MTEFFIFQFHYHTAMKDSVVKHKIREIVFIIPNLILILNIFVRVFCYDLIPFGFSCPYHTDCIC